MDKSRPHEDRVHEGRVHEELLRAELRRAAAAHRPDRARIHARVAQGMRSSAPAPVVRSPARRTSWLRIAGATAAVAAILVAGGYGVAGLRHEDPNGRSTAAPPVAPLWGDGSVDPHSNVYWAQSNVTFRSGAPLTALTVELRIARTQGVANTGAWISLPAEDFTTGIRTEKGVLVYRWTLKQGRTVPAGEFRAAGQYNHAQGARDARRDRYTVTTTTADGRKESVRGDFQQAARTPAA
ncbi:hypothetical protein [Streptomyces sp. NPDC048442]|uniref:hypothetical protein n=1 Tax=Streptomyces sp. NPDC048442 TaxID=3154823 RepID=UPI0034435076